MTKLHDLFTMNSGSATVFGRSCLPGQCVARGGRGAQALLCGIGIVLACLTSASSALAAETTCSSETLDGDASRWQALFDGKTLKNWKITRFGGEGQVIVEDGVIEMGMGSPLTGITYIEQMPTCDYEVRVEAMRIDGIDFFSTVTFPVKDSSCSLVVGGWAGAVVGISSIDRYDASENETTTYQRFESKKWYMIRIRVRDDRIQAWIDDKQVVDLDTSGHTLSTRAEVSLSQPLGIACYQTRAGIRRIEMRKLARQ